MNRFRLSISAVVLLIAGIGRSVAAQQTIESRRASHANTHDTSGNAMRELYGKIVSVDGFRITIETRTRQVITVDATDAVQAHMSVPFVVGHAVGAKGISDAKNVVHAQVILRAKASPEMWPADH
jgi:hypothetical protein